MGYAKHGTDIIIYQMNIISILVGDSYGVSQTPYKHTTMFHKGKQKHVVDTIMHQQNWNAVDVFN